MTDRFDGLEVLKIHHVLRKAGMADRMARGWGLQQVENVVAIVTYGMACTLALCKQIASSRRARERITRRRTTINKVGSGEYNSTLLVAFRHVINSLAALSENVI